MTEIASFSPNRLLRLLGRSTVLSTCAQSPRQEGMAMWLNSAHESFLGTATTVTQQLCVEEGRLSCLCSGGPTVLDRH